MQPPATRPALGPFARTARQPPARRGWADRVAAAFLLLTGTQVHAFDLVLRIGEPAPGLGQPVPLIENFVEPPSTNESAVDGKPFLVMHVTVAGSGVTAANSHVIYRWSQATGVMKVARGGDLVVFGGGNRALTLLESPIVDALGYVAFTSQLDDGTRGMVVWSPPSTLTAVAKVGEAVTITCQSVSGAPCGPVGGTLSTMATFDQRKAAAFTTFEDPVVPGVFRHRVVYRGAVQTMGGFGVPDALWRREVLDGGSAGALVNVANSLQKAPGTTAQTYFDDFTDVALCGDSIFGLATVSRDAPFAIYEFDPFGVDHELGVRYHAPDMVPRGSFDCTLPGTVAYTGGVTDMPFDGDVTTKGVWIFDINVHVQAYRNTVTAPPDLPDAALGVPLGQASVIRGSVLAPVVTVFAARIVGTPLNGSAGIWYRNSLGFLEPVVREGQVVPNFDSVVDLHAVAVNANTAAALHMQLLNHEVIWLAGLFGGFTPAFKSGDTFPDGKGGSEIIDSFAILGSAPPGNNLGFTGTGTSGHQGALTSQEELALIVRTRAIAPGARQVKGQPTGAAIVNIAIPSILFADGFEG